MDDKRGGSHFKERAQDGRVLDCLLRPEIHTILCCDLCLQHE